MWYNSGTGTSQDGMLFSTALMPLAAHAVKKKDGPRELFSSYGIAIQLYCTTTTVLYTVLYAFHYRKPAIPSLLSRFTTQNTVLQYTVDER